VFRLKIVGAQVMVAMLAAGCAAMQQPVAEIPGALPGAAFKDCDECPLMVIVPPGEFLMGSPPGTGPRGRSEGPQFTATIPRPVAVGRFEITRDDPDEACRHANVGDLTRDRVVWLGAGQKWAMTHNCDDGFGFTAPVGRFKANRFGLHDLLGNAGEWVEDCWNDTHAGAPADGSARVSGNCRLRVVRGGAWSTGPTGVRSALRSGHPPEIRISSLGFRVARDLQSEG
jgi:formylglycine-generating enzyme required for sulfatase activity